jgi:cell division septum initiation protein DivIVA
MPAARVQAAHGLELLGPYRGSGFRDERFLVKRHDGQVVHLTRLLYLSLAALDGRTTGEAAAEVSREYGRELSSNGLDFLVDTKLKPLGLVATGDEPVPAPRANPLLALRFHGTLLPLHAVRILARLLAPLFHPSVVAAGIAALITVDVWLLGRADLEGALVHTLVTPGLVAGLIVAVAICSLVHEFGHAAACHYSAGRPGAIGVGIYLIWPAFYTDVTDTYRLDRTGRLRTDLGGIYFTLLLALIAGVGYAATRSAPLLLLVLLLHVNALQQLLPIVRLDGYYALGDTVGVPDLFGRVRPILASLIPGRPPHPRVAELLPRTRWIVTAWVLVVVPLLLVATVLLVLQLPTIVATTVVAVSTQAGAAVEAWQTRDMLGLILVGIAIPVLVVPLLGLAALAWASLSRLLRAAHRRWRHDPRRADGSQLTAAAMADAQVPERNDHSPERIRVLEAEVGALRRKLGAYERRRRESDASIRELSAQIGQLLGTGEPPTRQPLSARRHDVSSEAARPEADAAAIRDDAADRADGLIREARQQADSILYRARTSADRLVAAARADVELLRMTADREAASLARNRDSLQRVLIQLHKLQDVLAEPDGVGNLVPERGPTSTPANGHHRASPN